MATKELKAMKADDLHKRWQGHMQRIYKESVFIFTTRYRFREVRILFQKNPKLQEVGSDVYQWLFGMWGRDALMGIRRELDTQSNTINLRHLMLEIESRPDVLTRARYLAFAPPDAEPFLVHIMNGGFDNLGAMSVLSGSKNPNDDVIAPERVVADRKALETGTRRAFEYAQRMVAHRTPLGDAFSVTLADINAAMDCIEDIFKKYYLLFTGRALMSAEAAIQYN